MGTAVGREIVISVNRKDIFLTATDRVAKPNNAATFGCYKPQEEYFDGTDFPLQ
jgi:hypothetical protein